MIATQFSSSTVTTVVTTEESGGFLSKRKLLLRSAYTAMHFITGRVVTVTLYETDSMTLPLRRSTTPVIYGRNVVKKSIALTPAVDSTTVRVLGINTTPLLTATIR
jgi:hypothetical protein